MFERHAGNDRAVLVQLAFGKAALTDDLEELQALAASAVSTPASATALILRCMQAKARLPKLAWRVPRRPPNS